MLLHLRVALLLHGDEGGQGVGEAEQLRLRDHVCDAPFMMIVWMGKYNPVKDMTN